MNPSYIAIFLIIFVILMLQREQKRHTAARRIIANKKNGEKKMTVLLNGFEGKEVTLYTLNDSVAGRVVEINDGWVKIDSGKEVSTVNLDYVIRVRERYVKKKD